MSRDCVREGIGYIAQLDLLLVDFVGVLGVCQEVGHEPETQRSWAFALIQRQAGEKENHPFIEFVKFKKSLSKFSTYKYK